MKNAFKLVATGLIATTFSTTTSISAEVQPKNNQNDLMTRSMIYWDINTEETKKKSREEYESLELAEILKQIDEFEFQEQLRKSDKKATKKEIKLIEENEINEKLELFILAETKEDDEINQQIEADRLMALEMQKSLFGYAEFMFSENLKESKVEIEEPVIEKERAIIITNNPIEEKEEEFESSGVQGNLYEEAGIFIGKLRNEEVAKMLPDYVELSEKIKNLELDLEQMQGIQLQNEDRHAFDFHLHQRINNLKNDITKFNSVKKQYDILVAEIGDSINYTTELMKQFHISENKAKEILEILCI